MLPAQPAGTATAADFAIVSQNCFGTFQPTVARTYETAVAAIVTSTAVNTTFSLPAALNGHGTRPADLPGPGQRRPGHDRLPSGDRGR
jgi:hypothetical protein